MVTEIKKTTIILPMINHGSYRTIMRYVVNHEHICEFISVFAVNMKSQKKHRVAAERIAYYFKREFGYDFVPYNAADEDAQIYGFINEQTDELIGCMCVRQKKTIHSDKSEKMRWWIDWAWMHPYFRNKNIIGPFIPTLISLHPNPILETPLSKAAIAFAKKHNLSTENW